MAEGRCDFGGGCAVGWPVWNVTLLFVLLSPSYEVCGEWPWYAVSLV